MVGGVETIVAVATAPGRGAIGVVRVSGPGVRDIASSLCGRVPEPRSASYAVLRDQSGDAIDASLVIFFPCPNSFTGEDVLELQGHGNPIVLGRIVDSCVAAGARVARPGEFSERAYLNGKIDLAQAEAVADLIEAGSRKAAQAALVSLSGEFSEVVFSLVREVNHLRIVVEAMIDFPDEDISVPQLLELGGQIEKAVVGLRDVHDRALRGRVLREGVTVALVGEPNVGKSSLLNRLVGEDMAIVSDVPGTTRDLVRGEVLGDGVRVQLVDTAGQRQALDPVERIGIDRGRVAGETAQLVLLVIDARQDCGEAVRRLEGFGRWAVKRFVVRNKADLASSIQVEWAGEEPVFKVSARTGLGVEALRAAITRVIGWGGDRDESVFLARDRHVGCLERARKHLESARGFGASEIEVLAEELRYAEYALSEIVGRRSADELLGEIFASFCIGK